MISGPPAVSVLIPCYNAAATVNEALTSLFEQTRRDFEVVMVDDGSTDETLPILQGWTRSDARFRLICRPHLGIIQALNSGLAACRAGVIMRMDADDLCHPERLARQAAYLDLHPQVALVSCLVEGFPPGDVRQGFKIYIDWLNALTSDEQIRREIFVESPLVHPSVAFRREVIEAVGGYQERGWPEDYDLWLRLYTAGYSFAKVPQTLLQWREYPQRLTRTDSRYSVENFLRAKAYYLVHGPLLNRDAVIVWGAGMMGRRLSKHLLRNSAPLVGFIDIDPRKIGLSRRGLPVRSPEELTGWRSRYMNPVVLVAVGARGARQLIRKRMAGFGMKEGEDWWGVA